MAGALIKGGRRKRQTKGEAMGRRMGRCVSKPRNTKDRHRPAAAGRGPDQILPQARKDLHLGLPGSQTAMTHSCEAPGLVLCYCCPGDTGAGSYSRSLGGWEGKGVGSESLIDSQPWPLLLLSPVALRRSLSRPVLAKPGRPHPTSVGKAFWPRAQIGGGSKGGLKSHSFS